MKGEITPKIWTITKRGSHIVIVIGIISLAVLSVVKPPGELCGPNFTSGNPAIPFEPPDMNDSGVSTPPEINISIDRQEIEVGERTRISYELLNPIQNERPLNATVYLETSSAVYLDRASILVRALQAQYAFPPTPEVKENFPQFKQTSLDRQDSQGFIVANQSVAPGNVLIVEVDICSVESGPVPLYPRISFMQSGSIVNQGTVSELSIHGNYPWLDWVSLKVNQYQNEIIIGTFVTLVINLLAYMIKLPRNRLRDLIRGR